MSVGEIPDGWSVWMMRPKGEWRQSSETMLATRPRSLVFFKYCSWLLSSKAGEILTKIGSKRSEMFSED